MDRDHRDFDNRDYDWPAMIDSKMTHSKESRDCLVNFVAQLVFCPKHVTPVFAAEDVDFEPDIELELS